MAVSSRKVQNKRDSNGVLTGKAGTVYDVNIKYTGQDGKKKSYAKKGFATKKEATQHEAEMKAKLANPIYSPVVASQGKQTVKEYLEEWVENHGKANLRPSTFAGYKSHIRNHIVPYIGHVQLNQLTPAMLDNMFQQLFDKGLSNSTVRYAQRILSVSMEHARKYRYIEHNPARDIITKFGKQAKTPDPYTIEQMQTFMSNVIGTEWEMPVVLAGMYGLRMSEIIGLRTTNIDLEKMQFGVVEQMPFKVPPGTKTITEMAPTKSNDRILPITEEALPYFLRQFDLIARQKALTEAGGGVYYDNISEVVYYFLQDKGAEYRGDLLYERAKAEFDARMEELAALPPKEILDHAYEKIIKEDFLCHLEEGLDEWETDALLSYPQPLTALYIIYDCGVMQTPTSIFRDAEHRLLCGSVLPYEIPVFHKALSECGSLEVRPVAICVPQEIQEYCTELFGEDVQIAAASHDLFAKQVNGQIYRPLVEKYIAGEKRL